MKKAIIQVEMALPFYFKEGTSVNMVDGDEQAQTVTHVFVCETYACLSIDTFKSLPAGSVMITSQEFSAVVEEAMNRVEKQLIAIERQQNDELLTSIEKGGANG